MSGHSKWAKIKHSKGLNDAKRGAIFTKIARNITMAAMEGGGDPDMNFTLRLNIDKAKQENMPLDNIERAIKKGTGELQAEAIHRATYEAVTPYGVGVLIDSATDNNNRTVSELRKLIEGAGVKLGSVGSVSWQFAEQGEIELGVAKLHKAEKHGHADTYENAELSDLENLLIELPGVIDYEVYDGAADADFEGDEARPKNRKYVTVRCEKTELKNLAQKFNAEQWQVLESRVIKFAANKVNLAPEQREKLDNFLELLEERDDIDSVWTNAAE